MTEARRPVHLAVLLGASAGLYAVSLAGVVMLQSSTDRAVMDDRAPFDLAASALATGHDALDAAVTGADRAYGDAAARYDRLAPRLDAMESSLDSLAGSVAHVSGAAKALPGRIALPKVTRAISTSTSTSTARAKAPVTHARTGASGG